MGYIFPLTYLCVLVSKPNDVNTFAQFVESNCGANLVGDKIYA